MPQAVLPIKTQIIRSTISPVWDDYTQSLYFVSRNTTGQQNSIFRYSYEDDTLYSAYVQGLNSLAFILPVAAKSEKTENQFVVGYGKYAVTIQWNGKSTKAKVLHGLFPLDENIPMSRTGAARTSPNGRFFAGTYFDPKRCNNVSATLSLYRYNPSSVRLRRLFGNFKSTAGIAFDTNAKKLYHLDACQLIITEFDWNPKTGRIGIIWISMIFRWKISIFCVSFKAIVVLDSILNVMMNWCP